MPDYPLSVSLRFFYYSELKRYEYTKSFIGHQYNEIQRREWLKVSFSILDICTEFIKVEEYNEFIYIGFSLKNKRKKVIPETLKLSMIDKRTPPFIILSKKRIEISEDYFAAKNLSEMLHKKVFIWQYKEGGFFSTNVYITLY